MSKAATVTLSLNKVQANILKKHYGIKDLETVYKMAVQNQVQEILIHKAAHK